MMQTVDHPSKLKAVRNEMNMCGTSSALDVFKKRLMRCDDTLTTSVLIHSCNNGEKQQGKQFGGVGCHHKHGLVFLGHTMSTQGRELKLLFLTHNLVLII